MPHLRGLGPSCSTVWDGIGESSELQEKTGRTPVTILMKSKEFGTNAQKQLFGNISDSICYKNKFKHCKMIPLFE